MLMLTTLRCTGASCGALSIAVQQRCNLPCRSTRPRGRSDPGTSDHGAGCFKIRHHQEARGMRDGNLAFSYLRLMAISAPGNRRIPRAHSHVRMCVCTLCARAAHVAAPRLVHGAGGAVRVPVLLRAGACSYRALEIPNGRMRLFKSCTCMRTCPGNTRDRGRQLPVPMPMPWSCSPACAWCWQCASMYRHG